MIKILKEELAETRGFLKNTPRRNEQMVSYLQGKMDGQGDLEGSFREAFV